MIAHRMNARGVVVSHGLNPLSLPLDLFGDVPPGDVVAAVEVSTIATSGRRTAAPAELGFFDGAAVLDSTADGDADALLELDEAPVGMQADAAGDASALLDHEGTAAGAQSDAAGDVTGEASVSAKASSSAQITGDAGASPSIAERVRVKE